jgi:tetratricopeptide (TPR) repeat protein
MVVDLRLLLAALLLATATLGAQQGSETPRENDSTATEAKADLPQETEARLAAGAFKLEVRRLGRAGWSIDLIARQARLLDVLSTLASQTEHRIETSTPELTASLDGTLIDVHRKRDNLRDLVRDLVESAGLRFELDRKEKTLRIGEIPAPEDELAIEFYRQRGIEALFDAYGDKKDDADMAVFKRLGAELDLAGPKLQDLRAAVVKILEWLDNDNFHAENSPEGPELCLRAARIALEVQSSEQVWDLYDRFLRKYQFHPLVSRMRIIAAQARMQEEIWIEAVRILQAVVISGNDGQVPRREALTAELLLAECYGKLGDVELAVRRLDDIPMRYGREDVDLRALVPYLRGLLLREQGKNETAMLSFRLCAKMTPDPARRVRALRQEAEIALNIGLPFKALTAARIAAASKPQGRDAFAIERIMAKAHQALSLDERALDILEKLAARLDELFEGKRIDPELAAELLDDIAELRFRRDELEHAVALFATLTENPRLHRRASYMLALCRHRQDRHADAIHILDDLLVEDDHMDMTESTEPREEAVAVQDGNGESAPQVDELGLRIRALRGDCLVALRLFERAVENYQETGP